MTVFLKAEVDEIGANMIKKKSYFYKNGRYILVKNHL